ncbi:MAG: STAS domain-containing protein [Candidatus Fermentibacteraceae bacterium]|nr:STAS domain-containing protein [Candidatus Fermentibacteraceae bacterium]
MKIKEEIKDGIKVIRLSGKVISGPDLMDLKTVFQTSINNDMGNVLLDLGHVAWMDSSGLGVLVSGHTSLAREGGRMAILNATKKINELFIITKLITIFETFTSEDEALASLKE